MKIPLIKVAVVEDSFEDREWLLLVFKKAQFMNCVAVCCSVEEALKKLPAARPDVVLMDIELGGKRTGIDCVRLLKRQLDYGTQFMMLTRFEDHQRIFEALAAGATGYLVKDLPVPKLIESIRELSAGGAPMSGQIARQVVRVFQTDTEPASRTDEGISALTVREREVLECLAKGYLYKEVADRLGISDGSVRTYVWHIYRKLHVNNRTEAAMKLLR